MCYYNGIKVTRDEYIRLKALEKRFAFLNDEMAIYKGFDYGDYPVIRPKANSHETERVEMQWGFLPPYVNTTEKIKNFRYGYKDATGKWKPSYTTLNATSEQLLEKMYKDAALHRRCLIPSAGFYEWRHVQVVGKSGKLLKTPEKFPYHIEMVNQPEFYMAGIWQPNTNLDTGITTDTFAIVTTDANTLMKQIHNSKERMPTILPGDVAEAWLYKDLNDQEILDIANYQVASAEMKATPLHKDFLKRDNPHEEVIYQEVPELVYS
ncbi:SOS response-associated peptidase family protein [Agriterribacter sp.]|uniref:SOS response-associated peptidase n=1 Tax=Agriterribacter sp. TaxID=2821509 RepID=UPI002BB6FFBE|nr:SOS response-associated peptidase family protein [Agriterribacter sp.]HRO46349.1 SOS response-associated peptidase family protein [Agriterribacter sp.]HRQ17516.1 SOS response-associated peptidase family protein [Agriterribacter sp.]